MTAAQKIKKKIVGRLLFFRFLNAYELKTQLIKAFNSHDSSRPYQRLLENPKTGGSRELFLPENNFKTCSAVNFHKKTSRFWRPGNQPKTWSLHLIFFSHALLQMNSI